MEQTLIYIAEGDAAIKSGLRGALEENGFKVRVFNGGYPVVSLMDNWPDLFLIDIELPDINGLEVCKWLKSHEDSRHIPVILLSRESYLKVLAASAHADDYVENPFIYQNVIERIRELLPSTV